MKIPQNFKAHAIKEFEFVISKLKEPSPIEDRLYYYSAMYGEINRIMNIECSRELVFLHQVLNTVHSLFQVRLQSATRGGERPLAIDDRMLNALISLSEELVERIRADRDSTDICISLINLAYATTGNGYYLYQKGELIL